MVSDSHTLESLDNSYSLTAAARPERDKWVARKVSFSTAETNTLSYNTVEWIHLVDNLI